MALKSSLPLGFEDFELYYDFADGDKC